MTKQRRAILLFGLAGLSGLAMVSTASSYLAGRTPKDESVEIAVAAADLAAGTRLEAGNVRLAPWPAGALPAGAATDVAQLEGRTLRRGVVTAEPVLDSALWPAGVEPTTAKGFDQTAGDPQLERLYPSGHRVVQIRAADSAEDVLHRVEVERGKSVVLVTDFAVGRLLAGDEAVLAAELADSHTVQVRAVGVGDTNLLLWDASGQLQSAVDVHVGNFRMQAVAELQRILGTNAITADMAGEALVLRGTAHSLSERERAEQVARAFFGRKADEQVINLIDVEGNQQVMIEVVIAEMSRTVAKDWGVDFDTLVREGARSYAAGMTAGTGLTAFTPNIDGQTLGPNSDVTAAIEALRQRGLARVLAEPTLVARSGQRASFLAGGEVPIPIPQGLGTTAIEFKKFGVGVEFVPTVESDRKIHLEVTPEVSEPDSSLGTSINGVSVPAFRTRRVSTAVELGDGQTFAIGGLMNDTVTSVADEVPGAADLPVLGQLFRSQEFKREETELVMIVTPRLVKPTHGRPKLPGDDFQAPSDKEFFLHGRIEGQAKPEARKVEEGRAAEGGRVADAGEPGGMMGDAGQRMPVPAAKGDK